MKYKRLFVSVWPTFLAFVVCGFNQSQGQPLVAPKREGCVRIATYNASLNRNRAGDLAAELKAGSHQAELIATVIRSVRPDILLVNELDYSKKTDNGQLFESRYLATHVVDILGNKAWSMQFRYHASVNTGLPSGLDLNNNDKINGPADAWGFGRFPGQYGMLVLSRFEIDKNKVHTMQEVLWSQMPGALRPRVEGADGSYYDDATWERLRLASKSFWDVPVKTPLGTVHVLASHPTPPAFDGPEDRNGCRNHDEIKLIQHYIEGAEFIEDDMARPAGLSSSDSFVVLGDLNSDPNDGGSRSNAITDLLTHPRIAHFDAPRSTGANIASTEQGKANVRQTGEAALDTADFNDRSVGNLRVDYVLPSSDLRVVASGVFWPAITDIPEDLRESLQSCLAASDHHLVWVDVEK